MVCLFLISNELFLHRNQSLISLTSVVFCSWMWAIIRGSLLAASLFSLPTSSWYGGFQVLFPVLVFLITITLRTMATVLILTHLSSAAPAATIRSAFYPPHPLLSLSHTIFYGHDVAYWDICMSHNDPPVLSVSIASWKCRTKRDFRDPLEGREGTSGSWRCPGPDVFQVNFYLNAQEPQDQHCCTVQHKVKPTTQDSHTGTCTGKQAQYEPRWPCWGESLHLCLVS